MKAVVVFGVLLCASVAAASSVLQLGETLSLPVNAQALARQPGWAPNRMLLQGDAGVPVADPAADDVAVPEYPPNAGVIPKRRLAGAADPQDAKKPEAPKADAPTAPRKMLIAPQATAPAPSKTPTKTGSSTTAATPKASKPTDAKTAADAQKKQALQTLTKADQQQQQQQPGGALQERHRGRGRRGYRSGYWGGHSGGWNGYGYSHAGHSWRSSRATCAHGMHTHACSFTR
ncbi:hypothetical protein OEZ85_013132 [Tetradesmus obliquus]|uniref:Uncharacterized protein n=1 Tax=Tetradesmus obliquus TaxID=3088 RepID=A0ABY8U4S5_TETOB|nr:hypothetical protein OEZ85_013132 [Tetradesmus obliquus]